MRSRPLNRASMAAAMDAESDILRSAPPPPPPPPPAGARVLGGAEGGGGGGDRGIWRPRRRRLALGLGLDSGRVVVAWSSRVTRYSLRPISVSRRAWFAVVCSSGGLDGGWGCGGGRVGDLEDW